MMRPITKNVIAIFTGDLLNRFLSFVATAYLARILGSGGFGKISFALAIFSYSFIAINFGLLTIGVREVAKDRTRAPEYVGNIFGLRLIMAILVFGLVVLLTSVVPRLHALQSIIIMYHLALFAFVFYLDWLFQGIEAMASVGYSNIVMPLIYLVLVILFVHGARQIDLVPFFWFCGTLAGTVLLLAAYRVRVGKLGISFRLSAWKEIFRSALPLGLGRICAEITRNFPIVVVGFLRSDQEVGYLSAATKLVYLVLIIDRILFIVLLPILSRYYAESAERVKSLLAGLGKLAGIVILPLAFGCSVLAPAIINVVYGQDYGPGIVLFRIIIWFFVLTVLNTIYCCGLIAANQERKYAFNIFISMLVHIVGVTVLTLLFGMVGTALSVVIAEAVSLVLMYVKFRPTYDLRFWRYLSKPFVAGVVMGLVVYLTLPSNIILSFFIGAAVYGLVLTLIRGIDRQDMRNLQRIFSLDLRKCRES